MSPIQNLHSSDPLNSRKTLTTKFACKGTAIEHPEYGEGIQLQGDQHKNTCQFPVETGLAKDDQLKFKNLTACIM
ncbi:hypothetical protein FD755_009128 [Muntiacus reevesi]|uniref:SUI1 domain-containing protein n=1 Tax=Muntiacus reevesi TaxID=9886 RepID=A0A5J5MM60_MUNRE|nr:hypothetical protein FD755_009128 [Muntiacus reevesi]